MGVSVEDKVSVEYFAQVLGSDNLTITWRAVGKPSTLHSSLYFPDEFGQHMRFLDNDGNEDYLGHATFTALVELIENGVWRDKTKVATTMLVSRDSRPSTSDAGKAVCIPDGVSLSVDKQRAFITRIGNYSRKDLQRIIDAMRFDWPEVCSQGNEGSPS